jgi:chromosome segregation ATPase
MTSQTYQSAYQAFLKEDYTTAYLDLKHAYDVLAPEHYKLNQELQKLKEEYASITSYVDPRLKGLEERGDKYKERGDRYKQELEKLKEEHDNLKQPLHTISNMSRQVAGEYAKLQQELETSKKEHETALKQIHDCKKEVGVLRNEKESYVRLVDELSRAQRSTLRAGNKRRMSRRYQKRKHFKM